jgi:hypothetical protein
MIDAAILGALRVSVGNPDAIDLLALIELCLAQTASAHSQIELIDLVDRWGQTLVGVDPAEVRRLKRALVGSSELSSQKTVSEHGKRGNAEN